jgi:hypothetical protein
MKPFDENDKPLGDLKRVVRESPTLGAKPPTGATVLFDGSNLDAFQKGARMSDDKLLMEGANTVKAFQNFTLHLEFKLPFTCPKRLARGAATAVATRSRATKFRFSIPSA